MRQTGYNAVSYRDIAAEIGIKSASLHYHFPKKEDLGVALVRRYADDFRSLLADKTSHEAKPQKKISAFVDIHRAALKEQRLICLCAILGAEAFGLPDSIRLEVRNFFTENIAWLTTQYKALGLKTPANHAKTTLAVLEGAMIVSSVNDDPNIFEAAAKSIQERSVISERAHGRS